MSRRLNGAAQDAPSDPHFAGTFNPRHQRAIDALMLAPQWRTELDDIIGDPEVEELLRRLQDGRHPG